MSILLMFFRNTYAALTGYIQFKERLESIEKDLKVVKEHVLVQNSEMGAVSSEQSRQSGLLSSQDTRLDRIAEDISYIRGRLDMPR